MFRVVWRLALLFVVQCADPALAQASLLPPDERLARKVSVSREQVYLGELLEALGGMAGLPLAVSDTQGSVSGTRVAAFVRDRPLREVMSGLQELFSHSFNRWEWRREAAGYTLHPERSPAAASAAARGAAEEKFRAELREFLAIARLDEPERTRRAKEKPALFPGGHVDPVRMALLRSLSRRQSEALVRGQAVAVTKAGLPPEARTALRLGIISPLPPEWELTSGTLRWSWEETPERLGPVLWLRNDRGVGGSWMGGMAWDSAWLREISAGCKYRGDPEVEAFVRRRAGDPVDRPAAGPPIAEQRIPAVLRRAFADQGHQFLVDLSGMRVGTIRGVHFYKSREDTALHLGLLLDAPRKPYGELTLLRPISSVTEPRDGVLSWSQLKTLRRRVERSGGFLDLPALVQISAWSYPELLHLLPEYESTNVNTDQLKPGGVWRAIFTFARKLPLELRERLLRGEEIAYREAPAGARGDLGDAEEAYHRMVVQRLDMHIDEARVSLRIEPAEVRILNQPGEPEVQEGRRVVWTVILPGRPPITRFYPLQRIATRLSP